MQQQEICLEMRDVIASGFWGQGVGRKLMGDSSWLMGAERRGQRA